MGIMVSAGSIALGALKKLAVRVVLKVPVSCRVSVYLHGMMAMAVGLTLTFVRFGRSKMTF